MKLTNQQKIVLTIFRDSPGITQQEVADRLCLSRRTIQFHLYNVFDKVKDLYPKALFKRGSLHKTLQVAKQRRWLM